MRRLLVPFDGSDASGRALDHAQRALSSYKEGAELHLLNVQPPLPGDVAMFVGAETCRKYHQDEGAKVLAPARARLEAAKVPYVWHVSVGDPGEVIARYAKEKGCDEICMGTRGLGRVAGMLLGSVTTKVIHLSPVPVLLVK
ncbi:MAG: universal stress protein [Sulfurifustis sp.]